MKKPLLKSAKEEHQQPPPPPPPPCEMAQEAVVEAAVKIKTKENAFSRLMAANGRASKLQQEQEETGSPPPNVVVEAEAEEDNLQPSLTSSLKGGKRRKATRKKCPRRTSEANDKPVTISEEMNSSALDFADEAPEAGTSEGRRKSERIRRSSRLKVIETIEVGSSEDEKENKSSNKLKKARKEKQKDESKKTSSVVKDIKVRGMLFLCFFVILMVYIFRRKRLLPPFSP